MRRASIAGFCLVGFISSAQVAGINSAIVTTRVLNDVPGATLTTFNLYPSIVLFGESGVSAPNGTANRDLWQFSNNGGASAYHFQNTDYFAANLTLQLTGSPASPQKSAGFFINSASFGLIELFVNTDGHEVAQTGGISNYSFSANNLVHYNSGDTIKLGVDYFLGLDGNNFIQFFANGIASPAFEFAPGTGLGDGTTMGGFFQIDNDPSNPANFGLATFQNISVLAPIPEPAGLALLGVGFATLGLLTFRRTRG